MTDVPHFALPFRFQTPQAEVVEQDSVDEIAACVMAVLLCPVGFRVELPEFGAPDFTFQTQPLDAADLRTAVETWEPRASTLFSQHPDALDEAIADLELIVRVRTEE